MFAQEGIARLILAGIILSAAASAAWAETGQPLAIENVAIIEVEQGRASAPQTVLIADGQITAVGATEALAVPGNAERLDGRGQFLIPGLVDMHVHLFNNSSGRPANDWAFPLFVANGVTGVREMAARPEQIPVVARWREAVARGELVAPRVLATGIVVRGDTPEAVRAEARAARAAGADFIKVFSAIPKAAWTTVLEEAASSRLPVCGHVPARVAALDAAAAGQRSNEHLTQIYEACTDREAEFLAQRIEGENRDAVQHSLAQEPEVLAGFSPTDCARVAQALARSRQAQVPTLILSHAEARGDRIRFRRDARWPLLRADEQARWQRILKGETSADRHLAERRRKVSFQIVRALRAAGAPILAGTDAPMPLVYPGFALHEELELLVESGLTPAEALRAATLAPAEFLGLSESSGSIAPGKRADLVLLDGNPLQDIRHTRKIRAVVLAGRFLPRVELDRLLRDRHARKENNSAAR